MRNLTGFCSTISGATVTPPFTAAFPASATGGAGALPVAASDLAQYPWPPAMSAADGTTYMYTATEKPFTMPAWTPTPNSAAGVASAAYSVGNGWANPSDTAPFYTLASGTSCASPIALHPLTSQTVTPGASSKPAASRPSSAGAVARSLAPLRRRRPCRALDRGGRTLNEHSLFLSLSLSIRAVARRRCIPHSFARAHSTAGVQLIARVARVSARKSRCDCGTVI